jgi:Fe-S-cluster containining protein
MKKFGCKRCGNCCREMGIALTYTDITRWGREGRQDILTRVKYYKNKNVFFLAKKKSSCPFLIDDGNRITSCSIYTTRPRVCKDLPSGNKKFDECKCWKESHIDIPKLKRVRKSQKKDFVKSFRQKDLLFNIVAKAGYS